MRPRALTANLALAAAAAAVALAVAEGVLRRVAPVHTRFYEFDPLAIYRPRPGSAETFTYPHLAPDERTVLLRFNRRGYRGGDEEGPAGARRVAVFGDSFVEARLTREERTFPARLAALLGQAAGAPVAFVNAGVSGYGPDQELLRIRRELPGLHAQLLVVVLYAGNDAGDLVRNGLFRLDAERLEANDWQLDEAMRRSLDVSRGWRGLALVRALGRVLGWVGLEPARPPPAADPGAALEACRREMEARRRAPRAVQDLLYDHYDADLALDPGGESAAGKRRFLRPLLAALREAAAAAHVPLLVVLVPHPTDATTSWPQQVDTARFPGYVRSALTDAWAAAARAEGVACVDLFPSFWQGATGGGFYFPRDGHWSGEGQERAARLAALRVQAEGWPR